MNAQRAIVELDCLFSTALQHTTGGESSQLGARLSMRWPQALLLDTQRLPEKLLRVIEAFLQ